MDAFYNDVASQTVTSSGNTGPLDTGGVACLSFQVTVTASSGTNPTFQCNIQASDDGVNFTQVHSTKQITGPDSQRLSGIRITARYFRVAWIVGGTSPSFTFAIYNTLKDYLPIRNSSQFIYGDLNLSSSDNVSTTYSSFSNMNTCLHILRSSDGGTDVTFVVESSHDSVDWCSETGNKTLSQGNSTVITFSSDACRFYRVRVITPSNITAYADVLWASNGGS